MTRLIAPAADSRNRARLYEQVAISTWPAKRQPPDEWASENIVYGPETGWPGPRNPGLTPYMRAFSRAFGDHRWKRVVGVTAAQSGKTATVLDIIADLPLPEALPLPPPTSAASQQHSFSSSVRAQARGKSCIR